MTYTEEIIRNVLQDDNCQELYFNYVENSTSLAYVRVIQLSDRSLRYESGIFDLRRDEYDDDEVDEYWDHTIGFYHTLRCEVGKYFSSLMEDFDYAFGIESKDFVLPIKQVGYAKPHPSGYCDYVTTWLGMEVTPTVTVSDSTAAYAASNGWEIVPWDDAKTTGIFCYRKKFGRGHVSIGIADFKLICYSYGANSDESLSSTRSRKDGAISELAAMQQVDLTKGKYRPTKAQRKSAQDSLKSYLKRRNK